MKAYNRANIPLARVLRKDMTPWERHLWYDFLRGYHPVRFQRQKAIGNYIVDFYCAKACLVIEAAIMRRNRRKEINSALRSWKKCTCRCCEFAT